jgi:hypothetical protein
MGAVTFGGQLGSFFDSATNLHVVLRCMGQGTVASEIRGDFENAARSCLLRHAAAEVRRELERGTPMIHVVRPSGLVAAVSAAASAELGVRIDVDLTLSMSEEDQAALSRAAAAAAQANRAAMMAAQSAPAAPPAAAPVGRACPGCGASGAGKFCAYCGSAMAAAPAPAPVAAVPNAAPGPTNIEPPQAVFLASGIGTPIGAGSRVTVPPNHCFVGFAAGAIACNLQTGAHVLPHACDAGVFISLRGLPFVVTTHVVDRGLVEIRGTFYMQDPVKAFRDFQSIDEELFGFALDAVVGRAADAAVKSAPNDERQLYLAIAQRYLEDPDALQGVALVIDSMRPAAS